MGSLFSILIFVPIKDCIFARERNEKRRGDYFPCSFTPPDQSDTYNLVMMEEN
jgi:hypothetical protein